jgi:hypothetical protein
VTFDRIHMNEITRGVQVGALLMTITDWDAGLQH